MVSREGGCEEGGSVAWNTTIVGGVMRQPVAPPASSPNAYEKVVVGGATAVN